MVVRNIQVKLDVPTRPCETSATHAAQTFCMHTRIHMRMGDTSIRVSDETKTRLDLYKREGESYEDVILRLTEQDKWAGFGILSDSEPDTRTGLNRIRAEMRDGMDEDLEEQA